MASKIEDYRLIGNTYSGRMKEAENLFDRLLALRNHLGLLF